MQRLIFYGLIILVIVAVFALIDFIVYRILRLLLSRHAAAITNCVFLVIFSLIVGIGSWWGHSHTRLQVRVTNADIPSSRVPEAFDGFRIAQLSDLHLDSFTPDEGNDLLRRIADSIQAQCPDIIVFTGDLVTIRAIQAYPFRNALKALSQIPARDGEGTVPVYSVLGNHDYADYVHNYTDDQRRKDLDSLIALQEQAGWHMLRNDMAMLQRPYGDDSTMQQIALVGVENIGEPPFSVYGDLELAMSAVGGKNAADNLYTILLTHNPTHWRSEVVPSTAIDLSLSGHTHATQFMIGSWSPAKWKYDEWMGLYSEGQQHLYVNTGVGCVGPKVRIGVAPEVSILTLRRQ